MGLFYAIFASIIMSLNHAADIPYAAIESAFEANDYKALSQLGKEKMVIKVEGTEGVYSQSQASLILKDFFTKHKCTGFDFTFKGKGNSEGAFAIGNYLSNGSKYRVSIHLEQVGTTYKIENLSIEKA